MIYSFLISVLAVYVAAWLLPGVHLNGFWSSVGLTIVLSLLNVLVKPLLVLFTIPVTLLTLGLFLLVIDAIIVLLASKLLSGFSIDNFWWAILYSIILSMVSSIFNSIF